jgi:hypothetical protein
VDRLTSVSSASCPARIIFRPAIRHIPAIRALYRRLKSRGKRGDVVIGHCMRKLLHLVIAVWKSDRPFDPKHFLWEGARKAG